MADPVRTMIRFAKAVEDMNVRLDSIEAKLDQLMEYMQPIEAIYTGIPLVELTMPPMPAEEEAVSRRDRPKKEQNNG